MTREQLDALLKHIESTEKPDQGSPRIKQVTNRLLRDLFYAIEDLDITPEEFWKACDWLSWVGRANEMGLVAAGLGLEALLDRRMDEAEEKAGLPQGTPRTIEGPLYVSGSPESLSYAELETEAEPEGERLYMNGRVLDEKGQPVAGALVEVWHCNLKGLYSYFDSTQPAYNLRRGIRTAQDGAYSFKSFLPCGYACPPQGPTQYLLDHIGRHGARPAHIHFFVTAPGFRKLTTQINIEGDPLIWDDFAFATREDLIPPVVRIDAERARQEFGRDEAFAKIEFDFHLVAERDGVVPAENHRSHPEPS